MKFKCVHTRYDQTLREELQDNNETITYNASFQLLRQFSSIENWEGLEATNSF